MEYNANKVKFKCQKLFMHNIRPAGQKLMWHAEKAFNCPAKLKILFIQRVSFTIVASSEHVRPLQSAVLKT
jgi:hypothetical protein